MKRIAIYGRQFGEGHSERIAQFFELLADRDVTFSVFGPFLDFLIESAGISLANSPSFTKATFKAEEFDVMISIGGDGTMLDSTTFVSDSGLPMLGINTGRLGFLSSINLDHIEEAIDQLLIGAFMIDKRSVIKLETDAKIFGNENFALNELTIHKKGYAIHDCNSCLR